MPTRNGQRACINLADDFTFDGAVAQLARATRWQRVGQGFESPQLHSNPDGAALTIGADACRDSFGPYPGPDPHDAIRVTALRGLAPRSALGASVLLCGLERRRRIHAAAPARQLERAIG
jgi:hypothetical protein